MTIAQDVRALAPGALVELFVLDATSLGGSVTRFTSNLSAAGAAVVWQGNTYTSFPIEASGFDVSGQGQLPRPRMRVSNISGAMSAIVLAYDDLLGAQLTRKRTLTKYLDSVNFVGGVNPTADPTAYIPDDVFFVDRKSAENPIYLEFELAAAFDVAGVMLPRGVVVQNVCPWRYRVADDSSGCTYTGTAYFDANDNPVASSGLDVCGKQLSSCKARHGTTELPFGGMPGAGLIR